MEVIKKIDAHAHALAFPEYYPPNISSRYRFLSAPELIEIYDRLNIEAGILLPVASCEAQSSPITSEACAYLASLYPNRFFWFCGVDPRAGRNSPNTDLSYFLEHYKSLGAKGVGELTAQLYADDPMTENLFAACAEANMPVTIHVSAKFGGGYGIVDELGLPRLEKMLKKYPDLKILGHSQPFWAEMSADVTDETRRGYPEGKVTEGRLHSLMREYPNLYCDISAGSGKNAFMRDRDNAVRFIEEFSDRILYACDICSVANTFQYEFDEFLTDMRIKGEISEESYRKIVRENAIKLFELKL
ncbi:MAG: amidohydrolase family protein [Clostridia bacterium]|nr:amidohydrolase family protein [Clostridia bacterium]